MRLSGSTGRCRTGWALIAGALWILCPGPMAAGEQPYLESALPIGFTGGRDIAAGDLDGDADLDLVVAADGLGVVWLEATVWSQHNVASGIGGIDALALSDLDGDGDLDVAGASAASSSVTWWENPSWTPHSVVTGALGVSSLAAADMDRDGDPDLVGSLAGADTLVWWENSSSGLAWSPHSISSSAPNATSVVVADVDGDGDLDVSAALRDGLGLIWWESSSAGGSWTTRPIATFAASTAVEWADIDGDGDPDLVAGNSANAVSWFENDVGGVGWLEQPVATNFACTDIEVEDLDRDGDLDIAIGNNAIGVLRWWENEAGDGLSWMSYEVNAGKTNVAAVLVADVGRRTSRSAGTGTASLLLLLGNEVILNSNVDMPFDIEFSEIPDVVELDIATAQDVAIGDVDGDGDLDLAAAGFYQDQSYYRWYENTGTYFPGWVGRTIESTPWGFAHAVEIDDFDNDGDRDIVGGSIGVGLDVRLFANTAGDGSAWSPTTLPGPVQDLAKGDLDGDGDVDLAYAYFGAGWIENPTQGGGVWTATVVSSGISVGRIKVIDLDQDGDLDLTGQSGTDMYWWENDGTGGGWTERALGLGVESFDFAWLDLDADGDADLLADRSFVDTGWWEQGAVPTDPWTSHDLAPGSRDSGFAGGDLDRDGDMDFLSRCTQTGNVSWWRMSTTIPSWSATSFDVLNSPGQLHTADIDRDGDLDAIATHGGSVSWWPNNGAQVRFATLDVAPANLEDGDQAALLHITPSSEPGVIELATLELLFEASIGDPLSSLEANALVDELAIYLDDGSGDLSGGDTLVSTVPDLDLDALGGQSVAFTEDDPAVRVDSLETKSYLVVVRFASDASAQTPNSLVVSHRSEGTARSRVELADYDTPLRVAERPNVTSALVTAVAPPCWTLTKSQTGSGAPPVPTPAQSAGCPPGSYLAGEVIGLVAAPDPGWIVVGWTGSSDDTHLLETNQVTMPDADHTVTVHYGFPLFSDGFESGDTSLWSVTSP